MSRRVTRGLVLAAAALLTACGTAGRALREPPPDDLSRGDREALVTWRVAGRIAVSNGVDGGSGRIDWAQDGPAYDVTVRAPISGETWRLSGDAGLAQLDGVHAQPVFDRSAEALLARELGWQLPVTQVAAWIKGVPGQAASATVESGPDGLPRRLREAGWEVEYRAWIDAGGLLLPRRVVARRARFEVRIAIDRWETNGSG